MSAQADEPVDVVAREVQRLTLDLAHAVACIGLAERRIAVLEAALASREAAAPTAKDERRALTLKPTPKAKAHVGSKPVGLPDIAVGPPVTPAAAKRRTRWIGRLEADPELAARWARIKLA